MSGTFNFRNMNLANVDVSTGGNRLPAGRHLVRITGAEVRETKNNGAAIKVDFLCVEGKGTASDFINVHVPSSVDASRIGLERLKTLLVHAGHPNPDRPADIATMKGLVVGVNLVADEYKDKDGNQRSGIKVRSYYESADKKAVSAPAADGGGDEIPF